MDDSTTPHGILERMKMDMEMVAALAAAHNLLAAEAQRFGLVRGEQWRVRYFEEPMRVLERMMDRCPTNSIITKITDDDSLKEWLEWRRERSKRKGEDE